MPVVPSEIGPVFDLLLATRDGSTLPCRNKDGKIVNVSQIAYVTSIDRNAQGQHEETELQHKDQLIQLGSSSLIDREFDQWPQVTQGDWSGGTLQRIYSGTNADPSRYWDGDGVLWPTSDYLPQRGALFPPIQDADGAIMRNVFGPGQNTPAGTINAIGESFAFLYTTTTGTIETRLVIESQGTRTLFVNPADIATGSGTPSSPMSPADFFIANGLLWYVIQNSTGGISIRYVTIGTNALFDTIPSAGFDLNSGNNCAIGYVGNKVYLAVPYAAGTARRIRLYEIQNAVANVFTEINLDDTAGSTLGIAGILIVTGTVFQGDNLIYALQNGNGDGIIVQYNIASTTFTTVAVLPGESPLYIATVAGALFVISSNSGNMYLLQGGSLQHIGPVPTQIGPLVITGNTQGTAFFSPLSTSIPINYGPYAIFATAYYPRTGPAAVIAVFAYDVLRGRLFRMVSIPNVSSTLIFSGPRLGLLANTSRPVFGNSAFISPAWSVVTSTLGFQTTPRDVMNAQIADIGIRQSNSSTAQLGVSIISSVIDFTNAQPKLYRQILAKFEKLALDSRISVILEAWLDQDPASLRLTPDFSASVDGTGRQVVNGVVTQVSGPIVNLVLTMNQIATKLVYRITTTGGDVTDNSGLLVSASKLQSVIVRAATGWVQTLKLDLAPNSQINSKNGNVWDRQSSAGATVDAVVAYNFLRQLWRLQGGQCVATFPNGDSGPWLIQDIAFDSPKPFAASFRSDQQSQYQTICTLKCREDIA